jgi:hypothetical protein
VNVLTPPDSDTLFEGAICLSIFPNDGMWHPCKIERVLNDKDNSDLSKDLKSMVLKYLIQFKDQPNKVTVPLDYIRLTPD